MYIQIWPDANGSRSTLSVVIALFTCIMSHPNIQHAAPDIAISIGMHIVMHHAVSEEFLPHVSLDNSVRIRAEEGRQSSNLPY